MKTDVEMLPCPMCGGRAATGGHTGTIYAECQACGVLGSCAIDEPGAIAAWNTRAHSDPRPVAEGLREALEAIGALLATHDEDEGMDDFADEDSVGAYQDADGTVRDLPLTFGILRRARRAYAALATHSPAPMAGEVIRAVTAEMRRFMPNACGDWADKIDAALAGPAQPLTIAESAELAGYIHGKDYRDNSVEAVAHRQARFVELNKRYLAAHPSTQEVTDRG